jgi:HK97 family phage prohead protease
MPNKVFNLLSHIKKSVEDDDTLYIEGMASTTDKDRAGDVIEAAAWTRGGLNNYKNNPIILFNHNFDKPIGRAVEIQALDNGLRIKAKISKAAPDNVYQLVKDDVLSTFSVSFLVKDADYDSKTDTFRIKDAELLENSVVSVPMNQAATFSIAKSFESDEAYEDFKKTFSDRTDQSQIGEANVKPDQDTSEGADSRNVQKEIKMPNEDKTPQVDLHALAKEVAKETDALNAMREAERKAAERKESERKQAQSREEERIVAAATTGAEGLIEDLKKELGKKDADLAESLDKFKKELEEKNDELKAMRDSKMVFSDRTGGGDVRKAIRENGEQLMHAHFFNVITGKGWDEGFAKEVLEKAGIEYTTNAPDLDQEVQDRIQKEIQVFTRVAGLFREIPVNGAATVLPFQPDVGLAEWTTAAPAGNLENRELDTTTAADEYRVGQVTMNAYRLVSTSWLDNDTDEQILVNIMPMLVEGVARAHARAVESALLNGGGSITGLSGYATEGADIAAASAAGSLSAANLLTARATMRKFGLNPEEVVFIVNQDEYYSLLQDAEFANMNEVGDMAIKLRGQVGQVYGSPVVVSDEFPTPADTVAGAFVVNRRNYIIPRLRGVKVEQDYEVREQRRVIVASQALGFTEIQGGSTGVYEPSIKLTYSA